MVEQLDKLMNALYEKSTISHKKKHSEIIEKKLDFRVVVIVDFENYQAIPTDLLDKVYLLFILWVLYHKISTRISGYVRRV